MSDPRVIKRYANRKLYDTQRSRYVTLEQIAELIRGGQDVKIVDNNSKEDLTSVTLAQIIFEQEKRQHSFLPLAAMKNIIQSGGESLSELASHAGATVKDRVRSVFRKGGEPLEHEVGHEASEGAAGDLASSDGSSPPTHSPTQSQAHSDDQHSMLRELRDLIGRSHLTFDEWQKRVDERIQKVVETLAPWTALDKEVTELRRRTEDLERKLAQRASEPPRSRADR